MHPVRRNRRFAATMSSSFTDESPPSWTFPRAAEHAGSSASTSSTSAPKESCRDARSQRQGPCLPRHRRKVVPVDFWRPRVFPVIFEHRRLFVVSIWSSWTFSLSPSCPMSPRPSPFITVGRRAREASPVRTNHAWKMNPEK